MVRPYEEWGFLLLWALFAAVISEHRQGVSDSGHICRTEVDEEVAHHGPEGLAGGGLDFFANEFFAVLRCETIKGLEKGRIHVEIVFGFELPKIPQPATTRIEIEDLEGDLRAVALVFVEPWLEINSAVGSEPEEVIRILLRRVDHVIGIVVLDAAILVIAAAIGMIAGPEEVGPGESQVRELVFSPEVLDMTAELIERRLAIGAITSLEKVQMTFELELVAGIEIIPVVLARFCKRTDRRARAQFRDRACASIQPPLERRSLKAWSRFNRSASSSTGCPGLKWASSWTRSFWASGDSPSPSSIRRR